MDAQDRTERELDKNTICRLEWIAWAMEAARRHKEAEQLGVAQQDQDFSADEG